MATILRYIKHLKKVNGVGWRVIANQPSIETSGARLRVQTHLLACELSRSYATAVPRSDIPAYYSDPSNNIENLDNQLRRSGKVTKIDLEKTLAEVRNNGRLTNLDALVLIRCCGAPMIDADNKESIDLIQEVWETLHKLNVPIDVSHYNALLGVYNEKEHDFSPVEFLALMQQNSVEPNRVTYHKLIQAYCRKGDIAGATEMLGIMKEKGYPVCETVFNSLIYGHAEANDTDSALRMLKVMEISEIPVTSDTWTAIMHAHAKTGNIEAIKEIIASHKNSDIIISNSQIMQTVCTLAANGHFTQAEELAEKFVMEFHSDVEIARYLIKLIKLNQLSLAVKIERQTATDLIRHRIRCFYIVRAAVTNPEIPLEDIAKVCSEMEEEKTLPIAFSTIAHHLLTHGETTRALEWMKLWAARGAEIRNHYFWPILRTYAKANDYAGLVSVVKAMKKDFGLTPCLQTLRDYTVPFLYGTWENVLKQLDEIGVSGHDALTAIASRALSERKIKNAAVLMTMFPVKYSKNVFIPYLADAFNTYGDYKAFVVILRFLADGDEEHSVDSTPVKLVDEALGEVVRTVPHFRFRIVADLVQELKKSGLSISPEMGQQLKAFFDANLTPEMGSLIDELASGSLKQVPMADYNPYINAASVGNTNLNRMDLRRSFNYHLERKNTDKVYETMQKIEASGYETAALYAQMIEVSCDIGNLQDAQKYMEKLEKLPESHIDNLKKFKFATLLVSKGNYPEALAFLKRQPDLDKSSQTSRVVIGGVRGLMDAIAETKSVENLTEMFNLLLGKNFIAIDNFTLAPFVKIHIIRDEIEKAVEVYERAFTEHQCTPYKNRLCIKLVEDENAKLLQKVTDCSIEIHGETNSLIDLAFVFLQCGRIRQARKILENSDFPIWNKKITQAIQHFDAINRLDCIEHLIEAIKNSLRFDKAHLFESALALYSKKGDWQRGLALWTTMQEHDTHPTKEFLHILSDLLKKNNQPVPFFVMAEDQSIVSTPRVPEIRKKVQYGQKSLDYVSDLLARKDFAAAEEALQSVTVTNLKIHGYYETIRALLNAEMLDKALETTKTVLNTYHKIPRALFTKVTEKLINAERFDDVKELGTLMDNALKEDLKFHKVESSVDMKKLGLQQYLGQLKVEKQIIESARELEYCVHFGIMSKFLLADPSALSAVEKFANDMSAKGVDRAQHILWNYHFVNKTPEAEALWKKYIVESNSPLFRPVLAYAKEMKDVALAERLRDQMAKHPNLSINSKCRLADAIISVYCSVDRYDDALKVLNDFVKRFSIKSISLDTLKELRAGLKRVGKNFPYRLSDEIVNSGENNSSKPIAMTGNM